MLYRACVALAACTLAACGPYRIDHQHMILEPVAGLQVLERSTTSLSSDDQPLHFPKTGLPLKAVLQRDRYQINFDMPQSSGTALLFIGARAPDGQQLQIEGAHLRHVYPKSAEELDGYPFAFMVEEARGAPLVIVIRGPGGAVLGEERLKYRIVSRGVAYGIEWI
jgi:hypothetical protein